MAIPDKIIRTGLLLFERLRRNYSSETGVKVDKQKSESACLDVTPVRAGVALQALVAAVHVLLTDPALGVLLTVGGGTPLLLRVGRHLVV